MENNSEDEELQGREDPLLIKDLPLGHHEKVCSIEAKKLLTTLKLTREACHSRRGMFHLDKQTNKLIRQSQKLGNKKLAIIFMYEYISNAWYGKNISQVQSRLKQVLKYRDESGENVWLFDLGLNRAAFFEACGRSHSGDILKSLVRMIEITEMRESSLELHMLHYAIGSFCFLLLKKDEKEAKNMLLRMYQLFDCDKVDGVKIVYQVPPAHRCFYLIREKAFYHFEKAREALQVDHYSGDIAYFYDDPQEEIYPLLAMAKAKLCMPENDHMASDNKKACLTKILSGDDIRVALLCLLDAEKKINLINPTARLRSRYHITRAGVEVRGLQLALKMQRMNQPMPDELMEAVTKFSGVKVSAVDSCYHDCAFCLAKAVALVRTAAEDVKHTNFDELVIANRFLTFLENFKLKLQLSGDGGIAANFLRCNNTEDSNRQKDDGMILGDSLEDLQDVCESGGWAGVGHDTNESD